MPANLFRYLRVAAAGAALFLAQTTTPSFAQSTGAPPPNFKVAFIGGQGFGDNARAVLHLIKTEGAQAVIHQGDLDYDHNPAGWDKMITDSLGYNFPYFVSIGDAEDNEWEGPAGYQAKLEARLNRLGIPWEGTLGIKSSLYFQGLFIILSGVDIRDTGHDLYIRDQLAADNSIWRICSWHKNMRLMQVVNKTDETGWGVYEEARLGGAIIATGHAHSYSRTHLLSSMQYQTIASTSNELHIDKGKTFVFVHEIGGHGMRSQELSGAWWASIYTKTQNAVHGALFGVFHVDGQPNKARFYLKNLNNEIIDSFTVISQVNAAASPGVTVSSPNGGEAWPGGSTQNLTWASTNFSAPVKIEYSADGGNSWTLLESSTENDGSYAWTINQAPTTQGRIRVSDAADGNPSDASDGNFKIIGPATQMVKVSGDGQSGAVSAKLSAPFVVRVTDNAGNPVSGVAVTFGVTAGGGSLSNSQPQMTNSNGEASTVLTLGPAAGANTVTATAAGLTGSPQTFTSTATSQPPTGNLALNKPATVSSTYVSSSPSRAVDGNGSTYWRSGSVSKTTIVWLAVDLQAIYQIGRAVVKWNSSRYAKKYQFQVSTDGVQFTTVYTDNAGNGGTDDFTFNAVSARYVRLYITENNKSSEQVLEFEIYATATAPNANAGEAVQNSFAEPGELVLESYPNPFNANASISFDLPQETHVTLKVYNLIGEEVATLVNERRGAGHHTVVFEAANLPSGIYFAVLQAGEVRQIRRLILMK
jgi:hypothetical protein